MNYSNTFKYALAELSKEGIRINAHPLKLQAKRTHKISNEMLSKIGIIHSAGYYIDKDRFVSKIRGSIWGLEGYEPRSKLTVLVRVFRENGIQTV